MQVQMENRLPSAFTRIDDRAISCWQKLLLTRHSAGCFEELAQQLRPLRPRGRKCCFERFHVLLRQEQQMDGSLRANIADADESLILINSRRGDRTRDDLAEEAIRFRHEALLTTRL